MKIIKTVLGILLMAGVMVTGFFLPDAVLHFVDRENLYIKSEEMPEINLNLIPELSLVKKAFMASYAMCSDVVAERMIDSSEKDIQKTADDFLQGVLEEMGVSPKDINYNVIGCNPKMYFYNFSGEQETAVIWDVNFDLEGNIILQIMVDDKSFKILSFGLVSPEKYSYYITDEMQKLADVVMTKLAKELEVKYSWKLLYEQYADGYNTSPVIGRKYQIYVEEANKSIYDRFYFEFELYMEGRCLFAGKIGFADGDIADKLYDECGYIFNEYGAYKPSFY